MHFHGPFQNLRSIGVIQIFCKPKQAFMYKSHCYQPNTASEMKESVRSLTDKASLAFGDSYTYVQGTQGLQNYSFIGDLQNYTFTPQQLLTDEIVQNQVHHSLSKLCTPSSDLIQIGTSAGGPNWVEYLTGCFAGLPSRCKRQLWDFAFAGSDVSIA